MKAFSQIAHAEYVISIDDGQKFTVRNNLITKKELQEVGKAAKMGVFTVIHVPFSMVGASCLYLSKEPNGPML